MSQDMATKPIQRQSGGHLVTVWLSTNRIEQVRGGNVAPPWEELINPIRARLDAMDARLTRLEAMATRVRPEHSYSQRNDFFLLSLEP